MKRTDIFMRYPGGKAKALTLSYDDGIRADCRLSELMKNAGIKGTFNINSGLFRSPEEAADAENHHQRLSLSECLDTYDPAFFEVAAHGYLHQYLTALDNASACCEVLDDRRMLEQIFDRQIRGMAYAYGATNNKMVELLKICGIHYCRTTVSTGEYRLPATQEDWLRLPATCKHTNPRLMELCDNFLACSNVRAPLMFYLWGHSYEFGDDNNWYVIEEFIEKMKDHDDIWYATNIEIYQAWADFQRLEFTADGTRIFNPNLRSVWFTTLNGKPREIKPGETAIL